MKRIQTYTRTNRQPTALPQRQEGIAMVLFVIGMLVVVAMGGLALDVSYAFLNKSRLQNTVDAAALAGATVLDETGSKVEAGIAAQAVFAANRAAAGQSEMQDKVDLGDVIIEFSPTLDPFDSGLPNPEYVRVRVESFAIEVWLLQVMQLQGQDYTNKSFRASAVAGPSPTFRKVCGPVPLIICAEPGEPAPYYGLVPGELKVLKASSKSKNNLCENDIGNGNFQLARLGGNGGNVVRDNLAGGYQGCVGIGDVVETEPGNAAGPVSQGINTRFGDYKGGMKAGEYPPDFITQQPNKRLSYNDAVSLCVEGSPDYQACIDAEDTCAISGEVPGTIEYDGATVTRADELDFNHETYEARKAMAPNSYDNPPPIGRDTRRTLPVMVANCTGVNNGQSSMPLLGYSCFFLLQDLPNGNGNANEIFGEFVDDCPSQGNAGPDPTDVPGPYEIQLYNDPDSGDS
jgi:hypothetical protein